jgi:hypothetical protein
MENYQELEALKKQVDKLFANNLITGLILIETAEKIVNEYMDFTSIKSSQRDKAVKWKSRLVSFRNQQSEYLIKSMQSATLEHKLNNKKGTL